MGQEDRAMSGMTHHGISDPYVMDIGGGQLVSQATAPGLILRLRDSNRALENLLRELRRDECIYGDGAQDTQAYV